MKPILALSLSLALFTLASQPAYGLSEIVPVTVQGTLTAQGTTGGGDEKAVVTAVTNETILEDFGVTKETHEVVLYNGDLAVLPKDGGIQEIVLDLTKTGEVTDEKKAFKWSYGTIMALAQTGTFKGFQGAYTATATPSNKKTVHVFKVIGVSPAGLLKLKIKGLSSNQF